MTRDASRYAWPSPHLTAETIDFSLFARPGPRRGKVRGVPPRLKAWLLLTVAMIKSLVRRLFGRAGGIAAFRRAYDADGLPPVSVIERAEFSSFSRCISASSRFCRPREASALKSRSLMRVVGQASSLPERTCGTTNVKHILGRQDACATFGC